MMLLLRWPCWGFAFNVVSKQCYLTQSDNDIDWTPVYYGYGQGPYSAVILVSNSTEKSLMYSWHSKDKNTEVQNSTMKKQWETCSNWGEWQGGQTSWLPVAFNFNFCTPSDRAQGGGESNKNRVPQINRDEWQLVWLFGDPAKRIHPIHSSLKQRTSTI